MTETEKFFALSKLNLGDTVELNSGEVAVFTKLNRKNFVGSINGTAYNIPVGNFKKVISLADNKDKEVKMASLKKNDLFYINKNGNALLFSFERMEGKTIFAVNPISNTPTRIPMSMFVDRL